MYTVLHHDVGLKYPKSVMLGASSQMHSFKLPWLTLSYVIPCLHVSNVESESPRLKRTSKTMQSNHQYFPSEPCTLVCINALVFRHTDYSNVYVDECDQQWSSARLKLRLQRKYELGNTAWRELRQSVSIKFPCGDELVLKVFPMF